MNKKEYLNEEQFQKTKKKLILIAFIFLMFGILGGGTLIFTGNQKGKKHEILIQEKLDTIKTKREDLNKQIAVKSYECDSLDTKDPDWFANSNKCTDEETELRVELRKLNSEEVSLEFEEGPAILFYIFGGIIISVGFVIFVNIYMTAKRREINAFYVQQQMPIAQEGMEKMAPSAGVAAKEIAKGIKEGLNDEAK